MLLVRMRTRWAPAWHHIAGQSCSWDVILSLHSRAEVIKQRCSGGRLCDRHRQRQFRRRALSLTSDSSQWEMGGNSSQVLLKRASLYRAYLDTSLSARSSEPHTSVVSSLPPTSASRIALSNMEHSQPPNLQLFKVWAYNSKGYMHPNFYNNTIYNSQDVEAT